MATLRVNVAVPGWSGRVACGELNVSRREAPSSRLSGYLGRLCDPWPDRREGAFASNAARRSGLSSRSCAWHKPVGRDLTASHKTNRPKPVSGPVNALSSRLVSPEVSSLAFRICLRRGEGRSGNARGNRDLCQCEDRFTVESVYSRGTWSFPRWPPGVSRRSLSARRATATASPVRGSGPRDRTRRMGTR